MMARTADLKPKRPHGLVIDTDLRAFLTRLPSLKKQFDILSDVEHSTLLQISDIITFVVSFQLSLRAEGAFVGLHHHTFTLQNYAARSIVFIFGFTHSC